MEGFGCSSLPADQSGRLQSAKFIVDGTGSKLQGYLCLIRRTATLDFVDGSQKLGCGGARWLHMLHSALCEHMGFVKGTFT